MREPRSLEDETGRIRVLVGSHHPATQAAIRSILERAGMEICAEVENARAAINAAFKERPDACILNVDLPGSGVVAARRITGHLPDTAVVMLAVSDDSAFLEAVLAGASAFLLKETNPDRLPAVIRGVLNGETAIPRVLVGRLAEEFRTRERQRGRVASVAGRKIHLTGREWEVFMLLEEGLSTQEIAERMSVSAVTVRTHVAALLRKLEVKDRAAAIKLIQSDPP